MSNSVNNALSSSRELPGNIINNILSVGKFVPPFNKPLPSKNITILDILSFQDLGDLVFFNKMQGCRKLGTMYICLINICKVLEGTSQRFWKNINNRAKLCPPTDKPKGELGTKILIKINKLGVGYSCIMV